jgi:hypothetical protein
LLIVGNPTFSAFAAPFNPPLATMVLKTFSKRTSRLVIGTRLEPLWFDAHETFVSINDIAQLGGCLYPMVPNATFLEK